MVEPIDRDQEACHTGVVIIAWIERAAAFIRDIHCFHLWAYLVRGLQEEAILKENSMEDRAIVCNLPYLQVEDLLLKGYSFLLNITVIGLIFLMNFMECLLVFTFAEAITNCFVVKMLVDFTCCSSINFIKSKEVEDSKTMVWNNYYLITHQASIENLKAGLHLLVSSQLMPYK